MKKKRRKRRKKTWNELKRKKGGKKGIKREKTKGRRGNVNEAVLNRTQRRCHDEKRAVLFIMVVAAAAATKLPRLRELLDQTRFSTSAFLRIHDPAERFSRFITVSGVAKIWIPEDRSSRIIFTQQMAITAIETADSPPLWNNNCFQTVATPRMSLSRCRLRREHQRDFLRDFNVNAIYKEKKINKRKEKKRREEGLINDISSFFFFLQENSVEIGL